MKSVLCGTGWRASFYIRIANLLPSLLKITSIYSSSRDRADEMRKKGLNCVSSLNEALDTDHDAVIVATGKERFYPLMMELGKRGEFILSETTFLSLSEQERAELAFLDGAVMEQYPYDPVYAAAIEASKYLGNIDQLMISGLHNHHSAALARVILNLKDELPKEVLFYDFPSLITETGKRDSMIVGGAKEEYTRRLRLLRFNSSIFLHDFSTNQYHNYLIPKSLEIRGDNGILTLDGLRVVNSMGFHDYIPFVIHRDSVTWNSNMTISHITLGGKNVYVNPFYPVNLNDDEIGIATIIKNIVEKKSYRTIKDGVDDATLGSML